MKPSDRQVFRCAIYTSKSTEYNLDLKFNSLDAQREACEPSLPTTTTMAAFRWLRSSALPLQALLAEVRAPQDQYRDGLQS
jgi:hypothetical protein